MAWTREGTCPEKQKGSSSSIDSMINWPKAIAEHQRWLRASLFARLSDPQAVDEVMQEVSLAAIGKTVPLLEPHKVGAWLYRVALRQSMLFRRRKGRHLRLIERLAQTSPNQAPQNSPLDFLLSKERGHLVREAMTRLNSRDVEILLLRYTQDWSCREMANHLGVTVTCVEARLHRARQKLRSELNGIFCNGENS